MVTFKYIIKIASLFFIICSIMGCADSDLKWYSADSDSMDIFRKNLEASKAQISLAIEGEEKRFHIPLIYRSLKVHNPYSVRFVINTDSLVYDSVIIADATYINKNGEIFSLMKKGKKINVNFSDKKYSGYAQKEAFQAECILPNKVDVDFERNDKLTVTVEFFLVSKSKKYRENVRATFNATHEKWFGPIFSTYTN